MVVGWGRLLANRADPFGVTAFTHFDLNHIAGLKYTGDDVDEAREVIALIQYRDQAHGETTQERLGSYRSTDRPD